MAQQQLRPDEQVILTLPATKRFTMRVHLNCSVRLTSHRLLFDDVEDASYSFAISRQELDNAKLQSVPLLDDDLRIITKTGTKYDIGFKAGDREALLTSLERTDLSPGSTSETLTSTLKMVTVVVAVCGALGALGAIVVFGLSGGNAAVMEIGGVVLAGCVALFFVLLRK